MYAQRLLLSSCRNFSSFKAAAVRSLTTLPISVAGNGPSTLLTLKQPILCSNAAGMSFSSPLLMASSKTMTPIQSWGHDYIDRQKRSNRPLSPHLQIYKPQWTWWVSGAHRVTGCAMGVVVAAFATGMIVLPWDFITIIDFFRNLGMPGALTYLLKFIIAYPVVFHAMNGVRFLAFDLAYGMKIETVYTTAYGVVGISLVLALILAAWRKSDQK